LQKKGDTKDQINLQAVSVASYRSYKRRVILFRASAKYSALNIVTLEATVAQQNNDGQSSKEKRQEQ